MRYARITIRRRFRRAVALGMVAAFAAWQPTMLASMSRTSEPATHRGHGSGMPRHAGAPLACCDWCSLACAGTLPVPSAPAALTNAAPLAEWRPLVARGTSFTPRPPHRLPFPLGPPLTRVA